MWVFDFVMVLNFFAGAIVLFVAGIKIRRPVGPRMVISLACIMAAAFLVTAWAVWYGILEMSNAPRAQGATSGLTMLLVHLPSTILGAAGWLMLMVLDRGEPES